ncbi:28S ribosomal protein S28, mitochondrial [Patella vulgata]|uniref:28S ribosomal protein S28, mitochondrial n=1 Tax=Patella vulgata TaxID=6465 RepID=UPI00217FB52D|nr:28S ribosomal protein S28, mitochondrial [Patella vulgata]
MAASITRVSFLHIRKCYFINARLFCSNSGGKSGPSDVNQTSDSLPNDQNETQTVNDVGQEDKTASPVSEISVNKLRQTLENFDKGQAREKSKGVNESQDILLSSKLHVRKDRKERDIVNETEVDLQQNESESQEETQFPKPKRAGWESALDNFSRLIEKAKERDDSDKADDSYITDTDSFAAMLRKSKLMQIGDPNGKVVIGKITKVVGDDLYVDFGGKFHCVCSRPKMEPELYHPGAKVRLLLKDLEMTSKFLGSEKHVTILEADAILVGLYKFEKTSQYETMITNRDYRM